jgi:hypothetical protein
VVCPNTTRIRLLHRPVGASGSAGALVVVVGEVVVGDASVVAIGSVALVVSAATVEASDVKQAAATGREGPQKRSARS